MKIILFIVGVFILYAQYHYVYVHNLPADIMTYVLTGLGVFVVLLSLAKTKELK